MVERMQKTHTKKKKLGFVLKFLFPMVGSPIFLSVSWVVKPTQDTNRSTTDQWVDSNWILSSQRPREAINTHQIQTNSPEFKFDGCSWPGISY